MSPLGPTGPPFSRGGLTALLLLASAALGSAAGAQNTTSCVQDARTACLLDGRFEVTVAFRTASASGEARVMEFLGERAESDFSAFYWFFDPANFEMGVKMVDACVPPFNRFWVFVSGLTNQGFDVTVRDAATGAVRLYANPLGNYPQTVGDTNAFLCAGITPGVGAAPAAESTAAPPGEPAAAPRPESVVGLPGPCVHDATTACLLDGRFEARVIWTTISATGDAAVMSFGGARAESDQSAFFWFFDPANFEMGIKMVDACVAPFNHHWAFISGLTNQAFRVEIRDAITGATKVYENALGHYPQTVGDTAAFGCP